jgi:hypothetical protein
MQLRNNITSEKMRGTKRLVIPSLTLWEMPMTTQAIEGACAFAWRNYLLIHSDISENDDRRSDLFRYVNNLRKFGEYDFDLLQIAAVAYLKKLDELHDDRRARFAADQALAERLVSRSEEPMLSFRPQV